MYYPRNSVIQEPSRILRYHLGTEKEYSVWDVETVGGMMALWLLRGSNRISHLPILIYSDSQAFIKSIRAQRATSGYHLVSLFTSQAESLIENADQTRRPERIKLRWIAAHENVKDNERADEEAKKAAAGSTTSMEHLPHPLRSPLLFSTGIAKTQFMSQLKTKWREKWDLSPQKERFNNIDPAFPFNKFRKIQEGLTRSQSSLIIQIQTNHFPLNTYLHKIGKTETKRCANCWRFRHEEVTEKVTHFLFECPSFDYERHDLDHKLGHQSRNLRAILSKKDHVKVFLHYIGRLKQQGEAPHIENPQ